MNSIDSVLKEAKQHQLLASLDVEVWLAHILGKDRTYLIKNSTDLLNTAVVDRFCSGIKEMETGKPLAQLTRSKEFYGMEFVVDENVLIPRPESELLVDIVKEYLHGRGKKANVTVVDVGTGSGCVLLAILKHCPEVSGVGTEKSSLALKIARENAQKHDLTERTELLEGDLLSCVDRKCDVVVANLPYIGTERFNYVAGNVAKFEPDMALYGGPDGLDIYRRMFLQLSAKEWRPDLIAGEFGFGQQEEMEKLLARYYKMDEFRIIPDLAGIPRVFVINSASKCA